VTAASVASEILTCDLDCPRSEHQRALRATLACVWTDADIRALTADDIDPDAVRAAYVELARGTLAALDAADLDRECYWCEGDGSVGVDRCSVYRGAGVEL
jgi:hypothetical protein